MRIAVVGAGIFGCTIALKLQEIANVDLFDREDSILKCASGINQYRLHSGYHYPRSKETAEQSINSIQSFLHEYGGCVDIGNTEHYYAISQEGSLVNTEEYFRFLFDMGLKFQVINGAKWINNDKIQLLIRAQEHSINIVELRRKIEMRLAYRNVSIFLGRKFNTDDIDRYDFVINVTYANLNHLVPEDHQVEYQFEVCEKPIIRASDDWKNRSVVVLDGPFFCIDPKLNSSNHVLGHVEHAIHSTNTGKFPIIPTHLIPSINYGSVYDSRHTNIEKFKEHINEFFPGFEFQHISSMYTVRTVLPNRDHDDARPTYIDQITDKIYNVFSGKIGTCVQISNNLLEVIKKRI